MDKQNSKTKCQSYYDNWSIGRCLSILNDAGVTYRYEDYCTMLLEERSLKKLEAMIIDLFDLEEKPLDYHIDGYDLNLVGAALLKIAESMPVTAKDCASLRKCVQHAIRTPLSESEDADAFFLQEYEALDKILKLAKLKQLHRCEEIKALLKINLAKMIEKYFCDAYALLPQWQYYDVCFHENFAYELLSWFDELFMEQQERIQMDVADLFFMHEDDARAKRMYQSVLRASAHKDHVYYRYALGMKQAGAYKAKKIAEEALQKLPDTKLKNALEALI